MEDQLIMKIEGGIRGIRMGTKTPETAGLGVLFTRLKPLNAGMYDDLIAKYGKAVEEWKKKNAN